MTRFLITGLLIVLVSAAPRPVAPLTMEMYMSIKGSKQGQFKAESARVGSRESEGWFKVLSYQNGGAQTPDRQPTSDRRTAANAEAHPFTVTKEVDAASPKLALAWNSRETLNIVLQLRYTPQQRVATITLKDAVIVSRVMKGTTETVSFSYTGITFTEPPKQ